MISARLFIAIYETSGGAMIADLQTRARGTRFGYNEHGPATASWSVPCNLHEAFSLYAKCLGRHVEISASGHPIWRGRVEDIKIVSGGVTSAAYGYQRALSDVPYTQFWSSTKYTDWQPWNNVTNNRRPNLYRLSNNDEIGLYLQRGDTYGTGVDVGSMIFRVPSSSGWYAAAVSFDWEITLPTNWSFTIQTRDESYGSTATVTVATGNGATQTGSATPGITQNKCLIFSIYNNTGASYTATGETGTQYARITNIRVKGTTSAAINANEIVSSLMSATAAVNANQLSSSTVQIQNPGLDLRDESYEDRYPSDILNYLASLGDNQTPPRKWEWGVDNDQALYFRPRGSGRQWYVDIAEPDIEQTLSNLYNSAYAVYQEAGGRTLRGATSTDATSLRAYGFTRRQAVSVSTTSSTQANTHRDAALADGKDPRPRTGIETSAIYSASGMRVHPWVARPGDTVTIRNLPPTISANVDRLRTFVLSEIEFNAETGIATLTPEEPTPSLDLMVAREAAFGN